MNENEGVAMVQVETTELDRLHRVEEQHAKVQKKTVKVRELENDYHRKKDSSLAAKKLLDEHTAELLNMIQEKESDQRQLPFDAQPVEPAQREAAPVTEGWEAMPLSQLRLGKGLSGKLVAAGIKTIGRLDQQHREHGNSLGVHGIGPQGADTVVAALLGWLAKNRDHVVFDAAKGAGLSVVSPDQPIDAEFRYFKLLEAVKAGEATHAAGTIFQVNEVMADGRIALSTTPGSTDVFAVDPAEGEWVEAEIRCSTIRIAREVLGQDPEVVKVGAEFTVENWHGDNAIILVGEAEVFVARAEFEPVDPKICERALAEA
jgi:hypothetical protein